MELHADLTALTFALDEIDNGCTCFTPKIKSTGVIAMSLKQFNARYMPNDDRIIFRFNTADNSEYIFWLTRRITHFILNVTGQLLEKEYKKLTPSVENFMSDLQQSDKQAPNFTKAYEPGLQYPIGGDAVLVMDAKCQMIKIQDQDIFSLDFILPGGSNLNLKLPLPVMKALVMLLEELYVQANWGNGISKSP